MGSIIRLTLCLLLALAVPCAAQRGGRGGRSQAGRGARTGQTQASDPTSLLGTFHGVVKGVGAKTLAIQGEEEHTVVFYCNKKTSYFDGDRKLKSEDFKPGDPVSIDAKLLGDGKLEAVNVRLEHPKPPESANR